MKLPNNVPLLVSELDSIRSQAAVLWNETAEPTRPPRPGVWSLAQCLSHLALSTDAYVPLWREALARPQLPAASGAALRLDVWGRVLSWFLAPPPKIRFRTKEGFEAPSSPRALEEFLRSQDELVRMIRASQGVALDRVKIVSAYDARVRYSIWSSYVVTLVHQRRHLWQAGRVRT